MSIDKGDIEELGEAIEQLGQVVENNLKRINQKLENFDQFVGGQDKGIKQELYEIKEETQEIREFLESYDARLSRIEIKLGELFKEKEGFPSDIEKLNDIKTLLASLREDANDILGHGEYVDKKIKEFENRIDDLEKDKPQG
jgi:chromosome segregation ATPase